jgi:rhodanese-related sulfurtransferase
LKPTEPLFSEERFAVTSRGNSGVMSKRIDVDRARRLIRRGAQLVDVLPTSIYVEEHLPSAVNLPLESLDRDSFLAIDPKRPIVVYCFDQH